EAAPDLHQDDLTLVLGQLAQGILEVERSGLQAWYRRKQGCFRPTPLFARLSPQQVEGGVAQGAIEVRSRLAHLETVARQQPQKHLVQRVLGLSPVTEQTASVGE